jgi:hypothetical protein
LVSLMALGAQAIVTLIIFGFLSNTNPTALNGVNLQFHILTCKLPIYNGVYNLINQTTTYDVDLNGTAVAPSGLFGASSPFVGTFFNCYDANAGGLGPISLATATIIKEYGANCYAVIPCGMLGYVGDYLSAVAAKLQAMFTLVAFYLTPINFNILGFTIADMSPMAQMAILGLYGFDYIMIGVFIYKVLSPYTGVH